MCESKQEAGTASQVTENRKPTTICTSQDQISRAALAGAGALAPRQSDSLLLLRLLTCLFEFFKRSFAKQTLLAINPRRLEINQLLRWSCNIPMSAYVAFKRRVLARTLRPHTLSAKQRRTATSGVVEKKQKNAFVCPLPEPLFVVCCSVAAWLGRYARRSLRQTQHLKNEDVAYPSHGRIYFQATGLDPE